MAEKLTAKDYEKLGRDMSNVYESMYTNKKRLYFLTFTKGIVYGFGIFLGGTILVAILVYSLGLFVEYPTINKLYNALTDPTSVQAPKNPQ